MLVSFVNSVNIYGVVTVLLESSSCGPSTSLCVRWTEALVMASNLLAMASNPKSILLLVVRPGAPGSVQSLLVAMPFAPSSDALCSYWKTVASE